MVERMIFLCNDEKNLLSLCAPTIARFVAKRIRENRWNRAYEGNMRAFDRFCSVFFAKESEITQEMLELWAQRRGNEINDSQRSRMRSVIALAKYLIKVENRLDLDVSELKFKAQNNRRFHYIEKEQIKRFFVFCDAAGQFFTDHPCFKKFRRMSILIIPIFYRLLYSTGIRVNEARYLRRCDVDLDEGVIKVKQAKSGNEYMIAPHETMLAELKKYDDAINMIVPDREYFFPSYRGGYLSATWQRVWFRKLWDAANGENSEVVAYDFRHNFAIVNIDSWPQDGREFFDRLVALSKSMGHATLDSCVYYYELTPKFGEILENLSDNAIRAMIRMSEEDQ